MDIVIKKGIGSDNIFPSDQNLRTRPSFLIGFHGCHAINNRAQSFEIPTPTRAEAAVKLLHAASEDCICFSHVHFIRPDSQQHLFQVFFAKQGPGYILYIGCPEGLDRLCSVKTISWRNEFHFRKSKLFKYTFVEMRQCS